MLNRLYKVALGAFVIGLAGLNIDSYAQTPDTARSRMDHLIKIFAQNKGDTFKLLNGQDVGGTSSESRGNNPNSEADVLNVTRTSDSEGEIFCVRATGYNHTGSEWAAYPNNVSLVGQNANTLVDTSGRPIVPQMIQALRQNGRKEATLTYNISTLDAAGKPVVKTKTALIYGSAKLDSDRNVRKFFCATTYPAGSFKEQ